jgi:hypothetical protein
MYPKIQSIFKTEDWPGIDIIFVNNFLESYYYIKKRFYITFKIRKSDNVGDVPIRQLIDRLLQHIMQQLSFLQSLCLCLSWLQSGELHVKYEAKTDAIFHQL